jgi:hypothetical protein
MKTKRMSTNPMKAKPVATFTTVTGIEIELLNPKKSDIQIEDIANGLSLECRFGKQISRFYSVAQHSILVSALCPHDLKREGLLHDASEAYLGDVSSPLKALLALTYKPIEYNFELVIFEKYGLDISRLPEVKKYDLMAYRMESDFLRHGKPEQLMEVLGNANMIVGGSEAIWRPLVAKMEFLRVFTELFSNHSKKEA